MKYPRLKGTLLLLVLSCVALAQDVASFEKRVTVKKLANGLTVIICERPEAPVFSFFTLVDAGSSQDPMRSTGLAHMFEHMAFKGTETIGTKDWSSEKKALDAVEEDLVRLCGQAGHGWAVYVLRIATRGLREYYVYIGETVDFAQVLPGLRAQHPDYRIEYEEMEDASWRRYKRCLRA